MVLRVAAMIVLSAFVETVVVVCARFGAGLEQSLILRRTGPCVLTFTPAPTSTHLVGPSRGIPGTKDRTKK